MIEYFIYYRRQDQNIIQIDIHGNPNDHTRTDNDVNNDNVNNNQREIDQVEEKDFSL